MAFSRSFGAVITKVFHSPNFVGFSNLKLKKHRNLFQSGTSQTVHVPIFILSSLKSTALFPDTLKKKINSTMLKMLSKKIDRAKKKKIIFPVIVDEPMHIPSHHILNRKIKLLTKQALAREEMISSVLLREVQETIDSGQVDDELENIRVVLNDVVLMAKETAVVTWETQGPNEDAYIQEVLTRHSSKIRHIIINSHVIGKVPKFAFVIDPKISELKDVHEIIASGKLDIGPEGDEDIDLITKVIENDRNKTQKAAFSSSDPVFDLFRVDCTSLREKIYEKKLEESNFEKRNSNVS